MSKARKNMTNRKSSSDVLVFILTSIITMFIVMISNYFTYMQVESNMKKQLDVLQKQINSNEVIEKEKRENEVKIVQIQVKAQKDIEAKKRKNELLLERERMQRNSIEDVVEKVFTYKKEQLEDIKTLSFDILSDIDLLFWAYLKSKEGSLIKTDVELKDFKKEWVDLQCRSINNIFRLDALLEGGGKQQELISSLFDLNVSAMDDSFEETEGSEKKENVTAKRYGEKRRKVVALLNQILLQKEGELFEIMSGYDSKLDN